MSELDVTRRTALVQLLRRRGGQAVITTTDLDHVPDSAETETTRPETTSPARNREMEATKARARARERYA